jgi:hypothetical protein
LGPVVKLKANIASNADKKALAEILFILNIPTNGTIEGDVFLVGEKIEGYIPLFS